MTSLLARPWLRLPHLLAIYTAIALGAPCALFIIYELAAFLRSFQFGEYLNSSIVLVTLVVIGLLIVPYIYSHLTHRPNIYGPVTQRKERQESLYSPELAAKVAGSLVATFGLGRYMQEQSEHARFHEHILKTMHLMIWNVDHISLSDEELERLKETKMLLDRSDAKSEFRTLLTRFLEKYQEIHQSRS
jgi:hypothetical protein